MGRPAKTLLERVLAGSFRADRYGSLLAGELLPKTSPFSDPFRRRIWQELREAQQEYQEAVDGYKQFIKEHPTHERVADGYAPFKIGEAYYKQIPSDWFLAPPSYEKDQGPVLDALRELTAFTESNGESPYVPKARQLMGDCVPRLADHTAVLYHDHEAGEHSHSQECCRLPTRKGLSASYQVVEVTSPDGIGDPLDLSCGLPDVGAGNREITVKFPRGAADRLS